MTILIGNPANRCIRTCVISGIIEARKTIIGSLPIKNRIVIRSVVKHASIFSRRSPGRFITGFFGLLPNPVKGKSQKAKENCFFKRRIRIPPRPYCNCKKEQRKQKYFYFPLLLHSSFFNIFNHSFRHRLSRFMDLTCLKHRGIHQVKQERTSFCIYKQDRKNSDPSSLRVKI